MKKSSKKSHKTHDAAKPQRQHTAKGKPSWAQKERGQRQERGWRIEREQERRQEQEQDSASVSSRRAPKKEGPRKERPSKEGARKEGARKEGKSTSKTSKSPGKDHTWTPRKTAPSSVLRPQAIVSLIILSVDDEAYEAGEHTFQALAQMTHGSKKPIGVVDLPPHVEASQKIMAKVIGRRDGVWLARYIRVVEDQGVGIGVYHADTQTIHAIHRKSMFDSVAYAPDPNHPDKPHLDHDTVVAFEQSFGHVVIKDILGSIQSSRVYSRIAAVNHDVWYPITEEERQACSNFNIPPLSKKREDLRHIPFVTIDGSDAKDFDDAVWAEPDRDERNPGGYRIMVAIADVAHYVKPDSVLDQKAQQRGNSVYLPDYVIPMLPEALSNDMCSLNPHVDRACLVADMIITSNGVLKHTHFKRALMHSKARLTYERVEGMLKGRVDDADQAIYASTIKPLHHAYKILRKARNKRGALDIHTVEYRLIFDKQHQVKNVVPRPNLTSHTLIEEMMVLANTAVAQTLKNRDYPCLYRVHPRPDPTKIESLREFTRALNLPAPSPQKASPHDFNALLKATHKTPYESLFNDLVLRCQAQARYSPHNDGHFGLGLLDYCHFTSPIRRYSDLVVHRLLIELFDLEDTAPKSPMPVMSDPRMEQIGLHLSHRERQAAFAEREATERFIAAYLEQRIGEHFDAIVTGVSRRGLYVTLKPIEAEAFMPQRVLTPAYEPHATSSYYDEALHTLRVGRRTFQLGMPIVVQLIEASPITGHIIAGYVEGGARK